MNARTTTGWLLSIIFSVLLSMCLLSTVANATTLFTYSGSGIWSKPSVSTAQLSSGRYCSVNHTQTRVYGRNAQLTVSVQRKDDWNWISVGQKTFYNDVSNSKFTTYCSSGTYRLYFSATSADQACNINGSFYY